jgi:hypothetical protein
MARPNPTLPRRAPSVLPPCVPHPLSHFLFPRNNFPLPLFHLSSTSPCARWDSGEWLPPIIEPRGELPLSSPLLSLLPPSPACTPAWPPGRAPLSGHPRARPLSGPPRRRPGPARRAPALELPRACRPSLAHAALAHVVFKFSSNSVLNSV